MSIPQICPSCGNHISGPHAKDCCFGTPEYAHIGWPNGLASMASDALIYGMGTSIVTMQEVPSHVHPTTRVDEITWSAVPNGDTASAIRRLLDYLNEEPDEEAPKQQPPSTFTTHAVLVLTKRAEELRKEAEGISSIYTLARSNRNFAADVLEKIVEELETTKA